MNPPRLYLLCSLLLVSALPSLAEEAIYETRHVVLYNQVDEFSLRAPSGELMGQYINELKNKTINPWDSESANLQLGKCS